MLEIREGRAAARAGWRARCAVLAATAPLALFAAAAGIAAGTAGARQDEAAAAEWRWPGGDPAGNYFSALTDINPSNVATLGFAWDYPLGTTRGTEATPLVVDGTLYATSNWGRTYAVDAATGRERWTFVPPLDAAWGRHACCDVVNRGVAVADGLVYVAALDGWLYALDAASGHVRWRADTFDVRDREHPYTLTDVPLVAGDLVLIGNAGADFYHVRGWVAAFDRRTSALRWRFYTVPRDPRLGPQDQPHLVAAVKSWDPRHRWEAGGGGTVWDGMAYDPALDLVYFGTANGSPYDIHEGGRRGGDDLYTAAIVAVHAKDGTLAWYYQTTPGDRWDYDAVAKLVLADVAVGGRTRKVIMQANKNGFFYVLDRATGEVLSVKPFAFVNWARGIDPATHRPIVSERAEYKTGPKLIFPGQAGAHSWQPMAFDPRTHLVYIPAEEAPMVYIDTEGRPIGFVDGMFTVPGIMPEDYDPKALAHSMGTLPSLDELARTSGGRAKTVAVLRAFDVASGRVRWEQSTDTVWPGGVLATASGLVFQGDLTGKLNVYAADSGRVLARIALGTSVMAAPMTYTIGGQQYVALLAGYGGPNIDDPLPPESAAYQYGNAGRIIALKLGGGPVPHPAPVAEQPWVEPPAPRPTDAAQVVQGEVLYNRYCSRCHTFGRSVLPDLRRLSPATDAMFYDIVLHGAYGMKGMARWDDVLTRADAEALHAYFMDQAWAAYDAARSVGKTAPTQAPH